MSDKDLPSIIAYRVGQLEVKVNEFLDKLSTKLDEIQAAQNHFLVTQTSDQKDVSHLKIQVGILQEDVDQLKFQLDEQGKSAQQKIEVCKKEHATNLSVLKKEYEIKHKELQDTLTSVRLSMAEKLGLSAGSAVSVGVVIEIIKMMTGG